MKKYIFILTINVILILVSVNSLFSQETARKQIGISATLQGEQYGFLIPIWIGDQITIAPAVDFKYAEKVGLDYSIGIVPKYYLRKGKVMPFIDLKGGVLFNNPSKENINKNTMDWILGAGFGGEYFIDKNLSIGIELQGNFTISDKNSYRFGNPDGLNFNTATMIYASIYF